MNCLVYGYIREQSKHYKQLIPPDITLLCFQLYFIKLFYFPMKHDELRVSEDRLSITGCMGSIIFGEFMISGFMAIECKVGCKSGNSGPAILGNKFKTWNNWRMNEDWFHWCCYGSIIGSLCR